jgi:hypothetical protein
MRYLYLLALLVTLPLLSISQPNSNDELKTKGPFLRFEPSEVDMGKIPMNSVTDESGNIEITFYNDGSKPLILQQVNACCGTTVKEWPKQPILPGKSGKIKASFRVEPRPSRISRTVTVTSNALNGNSLKISILGEVIVPTDSNEIKLP